MSGIIGVLVFMVVVGAIGAIDVLHGRRQAQANKSRDSSK